MTIIRVLALAIQQMLLLPSGQYIDDYKILFAVIRTKLQSRITNETSGKVKKNLSSYVFLYQYNKIIYDENEQVCYFISFIIRAIQNNKKPDS